MLEVRKVSKNFGGLSVLQELSFSIEPCKITALVGPNGAGKTTAFNIVTGFLKSDAGEIILNDSSICGVLPHRLISKGIVRSFQHVRLFKQLTVLENVLFACQGQEGEKILAIYFLPGRVHRQEIENRNWALRCLEEVGLGAKAKEIVDELSYPEQKLLNLAQLLATKANLLLLDEPASGLDAKSTQRFISLIQGLPARGKTILIVEHNMQVVKQVADRVLFLHEGRVFAEGTFEEITQRPELAEVYFGRAEEA